METIDAFVTAVIQGNIEEGGSGTEIGRHAAQSAEDIRGLQQQVFGELTMTVGGMPPTDMPMEWIMTTEGGATYTLEMSQLSAVAENIEDTGSQIAEIVGSATTKELPGNIAGYAYQGQSGSSVIDVSAAMHPHAVGVMTFDIGMLQDTVDHEHEHELQASEWNAQTVSIGHGQTLDRTTVSEVGAMSVQRSIHWVSADYKRMFSFVIGLGITPEQARETARTGDLVGLGTEIRKKRDIEEPQLDMAI